ncbi:MAG: uroporphyrinogen decarboxylase [Flavobacteriales bacterium]|nr:uroporphyrinogen decarboxylase [Flavobacteriales bacterium]
MDSTEIIGYTASIILMSSFIFKNVSRLRSINSIGCLFFIAYGILLGWKWPIIIPNTFIIGVNLFYILKAERAKLNED